MRCVAGSMPEPGERRLEARQQLRAVERGVGLGEAEQPRQVGAREVVERDAVERALHDRRDERRVRVLGRGRERLGRAREAVEVEALQLLAQLAVARPAELERGRARALQHLAVERVELRLGRLQPRRLDRGAALAVGLVRLHDRRLAEAGSPRRRPRSAARGPASRCASSPSRSVETRPRWPSTAKSSSMRARRAASSPRAVAASACSRSRATAVGGEQLGVARVDRLDVELGSEAREVRVVLLAQLGRERSACSRYAARSMSVRC